MKLYFLESIASDTTEDFISEVVQQLAAKYFVEFKM